MVIGVRGLGFRVGLYSYVFGHYVTWAIFVGAQKAAWGALKRRLR